MTPHKKMNYKMRFSHINVNGQWSHLYLPYVQAYSESVKKKTLTDNSLNWNVVIEDFGYHRQAALVPARVTGTMVCETLKLTVHLL
jgi:hypothetical protein